MNAEATKPAEGGPRAMNGATVRPGGVFRADWRNLVFIHFRADPRRLQEVVPFPLDQFEDQAYLSLVAFRMDRFRVVGLPSALQRFTRRFGEHAFLNVRTYVRVGDEPGIFFLREFVDTRLSRYLGPTLFGLPYRMGRLRYAIPDANGYLSGQVAYRGGGLRYEGQVAGRTRPATPGSLDSFLLERYAAFTKAFGIRRRFRIRHEPWEFRAVELSALDTTGLRDCGAAPQRADYVGSRYSDGAFDVAIGPPCPIVGEV